MYEDNDKTCYITQTQWKIIEEKSNRTVVIEYRLNASRGNFHNVKTRVTCKSMVSMYQRLIYPMSEGTRLVC